MATINDFELIKMLIENNGKYEDDPIPVGIYTYINTNIDRTYSVCYSIEAVNSLLHSPCCRNVELLWSPIDGQTLMYNFLTGSEVPRA